MRIRHDKVQIAFLLLKNMTDLDIEKKKTLIDEIIENSIYRKHIDSLTEEEKKELFCN